MERNRNWAIVSPHKGITGSFWWETIDRRFPSQRPVLFFVTSLGKLLNKRLSTDDLRRYDAYVMSLESIRLVSYNVPSNLPIYFRVTSSAVATFKIFQLQLYRIWENASFYIITSKQRTTKTCIQFVGYIIYIYTKYAIYSVSYYLFPIFCYSVINLQDIKTVSIAKRHMFN